MKAVNVYHSGIFNILREESVRIICVALIAHSRSPESPIFATLLRNVID